MRVVATHDITPIHMGPADTLDVNHNGRKLVSHKPGKSAMFNRVLIVELDEGELGLKGGLGAILGERGNLSGSTQIPVLGAQNE
ncbi:hypothetical protein [Cupriavidus campinensis]|uniref:Uncharacterized protein n=1 Tax=Cupriavidus campinensis TaxID=151783 RepID=A0ABY3ETB5_9BURK|nr:hypothetical protein [Cupriavidus campinensis]TSP14021.1 hypothetical protein FGG12_06000 [Cupriavidus campinensis]